MTLEERADALCRYAAQSRQEALQLLDQLVEIESPSGDHAGVRRVAELLGGRLDELGLNVDLIPSEHFGAHLVASVGLAPPRVVLVGHLDTVFPTGTGWPLTVQDGIIRGPGVADMKGGLVVMVSALRALAAVDQLSVPVQVILVGDEEVGSPESSELIRERARGAGWGLVFEPAEPGGALINQRKGFGHFTLSVKGRAAHAGEQPSSGIDANRELIAQCGVLYRVADASKGTTINVGRIEGGRAPAIIAESASAEIDVRIADASEQRRVQAAVIAAALTPSDPEAEVRIDGGFERSPMLSLPGTAELMAVAVHAGRACGQEITFEASGVVSDANTLVAEGIASLDGLGPVGGRLHSREEWADLDSLVSRIGLVATTLSALPLNPDASKLEYPVSLGHVG